MGMALVVCAFLLLTAVAAAVALRIQRTARARAAKVRADELIAEGLRLRLATTMQWPHPAREGDEDDDEDDLDAAA